ncbi:hypothetical protein AXA44_15175 [Rhodococcus sp. SC4]|nr:hypothetical protein AXA44_15175 [Rhodococcus sp. SC4]
MKATNPHRVELAHPYATTNPVVTGARRQSRSLEFANVVENRNQVGRFLNADHAKSGPPG